MLFGLNFIEREIVPASQILYYANNMMKAKVMPPTEAVEGLVLTVTLDKWNLSLGDFQSRSVD